MALKVAGQCCAYLARAALLVVALVVGIWPLTVAGMQLGTAKNFNPTTINSGQTSILTIRFINPDPLTDASLLQFSDNFPAGMTLAPGPQTNSCGGSLTLAPGSLSLANGTVVANGGTCAVSVTVTATASVSTTLTNVTSAITCFSAQGCSGKAPSADLDVIVLTPPTITSAPPPSGTVGTFYAHQVTASGSPVPTFSASGLPPGLSFSPATNQIAGTPTLAGTFANPLVGKNRGRVVPPAADLLSPVAALARFSGEKPSDFTCSNTRPKAPETVGRFAGDFWASFSAISVPWVKRRRGWFAPPRSV